MVGLPGVVSDKLVRLLAYLVDTRDTHQTYLVQTSINTVYVLLEPPEVIQDRDSLIPTAGVVSTT